VVCLFLPKGLQIIDKDALNQSLDEGSFINLALSKYTCNLYHSFGHLLAPIEAALVTSNHLQKIRLEPPSSTSKEEEGKE
jgi:hypothetical protein